MRLRDIARVLARELPKITFTRREISHNIGISNFKSAVHAAEVIKRTGALVDDADRLLRLTEITRNVHDEAVVSQGLYETFRAAIDNLALKSATLLSGIQSVIGKELPDQISVKLPDDTDLKHIADAMEELHKALSQSIVNDYVGGDIDVIGFDRGSNWIEIAVHTSAAMLVIGRLLSLIVDYHRKQIEISGKREMVRSLKLQNDFVAAAEKTLEHELGSFLEDRVAAVAKSAGAPDEDNEYHERLKFSIRTLSDLITRGLEVHPSLTAPPEAADSFPTAKELAAALNLLEGPKKALGDGTEESLD